MIGWAAQPGTASHCDQVEMTNVLASLTVDDYSGLSSLQLALEIHPLGFLLSTSVASSLILWDPNH